VLVVDDNRDSAEVLSQLLTITGHQVQTDYSGATALESAAAFHPDVVLLDIGLPGLDGYEVAKRLRQKPEFKQTLLIAVSGYCQEQDRKRSREAGFDHHLAKPIDHETLSTLLTEKRL
jgi:two-component system CheB/CheR fusion protein